MFYINKQKKYCNGDTILLLKQELDNNPFIIAEVGQNHQGDIDLAIKYIETFSRFGADAIKFQTRNNKFLFSDDAYNSLYTSENAFGKTYGEHREYLELSIEELYIIKEACRQNNVKFMSTPFDEPSLELLNEIGVDLLKIASFDLGNLPFINKISKSNKPIVMSIGGGQLDQIKSSISLLEKNKTELAILHCVSEYPCPYDKLGLNNIEELIKEFPTHSVGSSDHFNGILSGPIAFLKGARVFEKHVTLNRASKGTDHVFALEADGFRKFVRDIKRVNPMLKSKHKSEVGNEMVFKKLGKSVVAACSIKKDEVLTLDNLSGRIFDKQYIPVRKTNMLLGKKVLKSLDAGDLIVEDNIY